MNIRPEQLDAHLQRGLAPVYLVAGDEPLLVEESSAAIRAAAQAQGYLERERMVVESGFDWSAVTGASQSMSLFSERRVLELRLPTGKPGEAGARVLNRLAEQPPPDTMVLVIAGRLDAQNRKAKWVKALEQAGVMVTAYPVEAAQLPAWLRQRMAAHGLRPGPGVTELLAHHFEGNLLAAAQEVDKLQLLFGGGPVSADDIEENLSDNARFNVFTLVDCCLKGDAAGSARMLASLEAEGTAPTLVLWALVRELRGLQRMNAALAAGESADAVFQANRVWPKRRPLIQAALTRGRAGRWLGLLQRAARADRVIKGRLDGDGWQELRILSLALCGHAPPPVI